jgi:hypothetical protein
MDTSTFIQLDDFFFSPNGLVIQGGALTPIHHLLRKVGLHKHTKGQE